MSFFSFFNKRTRSQITLRQELWIAILAVIVIGFISSVLISIYSAKDYFSEQLYLKNVDNANNLALMISQQQKDPVELELLIAATFDTGYYQRIEVQNPGGATLVKRIFKGELNTNVPQWFSYMYNLDVAPGIAQINDGWQQYGTLYVESHSEYTEQALWQSAVRLLFSFFVVAIAACIAGGYFLAKILRPLDDVVEQANALGDKRFIKSKVPKTYEFARLVSSMNLLSSRFSQIIKEDKKRLEALRFKSQHDEVTGLANREYFNATLEAHLQQSEQQAHGALFLFRVVNLDQLSEQINRVEMVSFLRRFAQTLVFFLESNEDSFSESYIARLSHADFAVLFSDTTNLALLSERVLKQHQTLLNDYPSVALAVPHSCCYVEAGDSRFSLLKRVDNLLKVVAKEQGTQASINQNKQQAELFDDAEGWQDAIESALVKNDIDVTVAPVKRFSGELIQQQLSLGLLLRGEFYRSGYYYHWARRLKLLARLDWGLIKHVVNVYDSRDDLKVISLELSQETLLDDSAVAAILTYLVAFPVLAKHICFDVRESIAVSQFSAFKDFCEQAKGVGAKVGLKRVGAEFTQLRKLQELGLEMIKVDSVYAHNISYNLDNQTFLRGVCSLAHSLGIIVVAEGVKNPDDQLMLRSLGFDGLVIESENLVVAD